MSETDRSLRRDRTDGLVGRYVATDSLRFGRYVATIATDSLRIGRYVATDREAWSVATYHYVATDSCAGRSLRSDRLVRYVATSSFAGRSLRSNRLVRRSIATRRPCLNPFPMFYERDLGLRVFSFDE
ncbi:hypothetical protein F2Q69_00052211 [Brassica cretica]|uniref:Uncharacterized protein n=1 Tax=Brassica cretica TaxID=69181 RepID=A0A8S9MYS2_BRACR|nr:hypothetical protein F2Q69_00052211 [Brassica cretica]